MKTVGMITIGQAPRDDVVPEMEKLLGPDVRVVQAGALDGLSRSEIAALAPAGGQFPLVTRLLDGDSVVIAKEAIISRLQACLDRLAGEATAFAILCTGKFPRFRCARPVLEPERILFAATRAVLAEGPLGVVIPLEAQRPMAAAHWSQADPGVVVAAASPYAGTAGLVGAAETLRGAGVRLVTMDCMGFTQAMKGVVADVAGVPVLLPSSLIARFVAEVA
jgi:protein AroM